jgi:hypothetical protein
LWRADARSWQIRRPAGVTRSFQVIKYSIEPFKSVSACNLLANDDWRLALADEAKHFRPQVSLIGNPFPLTNDAEWLARART